MLFVNFSFLTDVFLNLLKLTPRSFTVLYKKCEHISKNDILNTVLICIYALMWLLECVDEYVFPLAGEGTQCTHRR
jgi:hypothetical protein